MRSVTYATVNKTNYSPSPIELQGAPELFLYELRMFRAGIDALQDPSVQGDPTLKNVLLESALVHARNLLDFFSGRESPKDDIVASHFASKPDGTPWASSKLAFLATCKNDINKALSHLTYSRVGFKPVWYPGRIRQEIEDAYAEFLAALPPNERVPWQA